MNRLKHFRVNASMTQVELAKALGVSQPHYQRFESGQAPIPEPKLKKLAAILDTRPDALLGTHPAIKAGYYEPELGADLDYYGEVAFHFLGGGEPLLLSISTGAYKAAHRALQEESEFVVVTSLVNQTVAVRRAAIADAYFSSEAYDDYGPEHGTYMDLSSFQLPDTRDWEIIEAFADADDTDHFDQQSVERIENMLCLDHQTVIELKVAEGEMNADEGDAANKEHEKVLHQVFRNATKTVYQLSSGKQRGVYLYDDTAAYHLIEELRDEDNFGSGDADAQCLILFPSEEYHRSVFINKRGVDYISVPTHRFENGKIEFRDEILES